MDRRFLSQKDVIQASRNFVCVRMMTYENAREAEVLKSLWRPGAALENTLFAVLDPSGRPLTRGARSPDWMFNSAEGLASALNEVAASYRGRGNPQSLPAVESVRLAMNVSACDKRPLAIVVADSEEQRQTLRSRLAPLAWSGELVGKVIYASGSRSELHTLNGVRVNRGYVFVSPNEFGTRGAVIEQLDDGASTEQLNAALKLTIERHNPLYLDHRDHIRMGHQQGISWTSAIPVSDPMELQARRFHPHGEPGNGFPPPGIAEW